MFSGISSVGIPVSDIRAASEWYRDMIGAKISEFCDENLAVFTFDEIPDLVFFLMRVSASARLAFRDISGKWRYTVISFKCDDPESLYAQLKARGVFVADLAVNEEGEASFIFRDLEGNEFEVEAAGDAE